jgi:hypothetical protein
VDGGRRGVGPAGTATTVGHVTGVPRLLPFWLRIAVVEVAEPTGCRAGWSVESYQRSRSLSCTAYQPYLRSRFAVRRAGLPVLDSKSTERGSSLKVESGAVPSGLMLPEAVGPTTDGGRVTHRRHRGPVVIGV